MGLISWLFGSDSEPSEPQQHRITQEVEVHEVTFTYVHGGSETRVGIFTDEGDEYAVEEADLEIRSFTPRHGSINVQNDADQELRVVKENLLNVEKSVERTVTAVAEYEQYWTSDGTSVTTEKELYFEDEEEDNQE